MKNYHIANCWVGRACALVMLAAGLSQAAAQNTAFTYSGRLTGNGAVVTGDYDMRFALYDAVNGNVIAGPLPISPVAVANGLFTARIDFGPGVFTGAPRWLEVAVRPVGGASYTVLTPRHEVTSSPYAIRAESAAVADAGGGGGAAWSVSGGNAYYDTGSVGIGTNNPAPGVRLEVNGPARVSFGGSGGFLQIGTPNGETGLSLVGLNRSDLRFDGSTVKLVAGTGTGTPSSLSGLAVTTAGNVGVGTTAPAGKLHVYEPFVSATQLIETGGGINAWSKLAFKNLNGQWDAGTSRGFNNDMFFLDRIGTTLIEFQLSKFGDLGLGIEPFAKLHLYNPATSVSQRIETAGGINAWTQIEFLNANGRWDIGTSRGYLGDEFYIARAGSGNVAFAVKPNGDAFVDGKLTTKVLTITGGADIAEPFPMESGLEKGSVVVIDSENPGKLCRSAQAYDPRVAGVISGANGVNPGIALHQAGALDQGENVALSGRVYVRADAASGAIRPGDLLTTSDTPGHAMKVTDHTRAQGAILGKAMSGLKEGKGFVLVLVTLQ